MFSKYIEILNSDQGRIFKESKIREFGEENPTFLKLLNRTYSPEYVYNLKKVNQSTIGTKTLNDSWNEFEDILTKLASREVTGHAAKYLAESFLQILTKEEATVAFNVLQGDLRCGINVSSINKAFPNLVPEYPYMRCSLVKGSNFNKFNWKNGIYSQQKADGMFANVYYDTAIKITSRNGTLFANTEFRDFINEFTSKADSGYCYHGELLVIQDDNVLPREIGNGILNSVLKGGSFESNQKPFYFIWDKIPVKDAVAGGKYKTPYKDRFNSIQHLTGMFFNIIPTKIVYSAKEAFEHYIELTAAGIEGTVVKNPEAIWEDKTSKDQVKLKIEAEVDLIVRGFNEGNGKNASLFGSLIAESVCGKLRVSIPGFTDELRKRIFEEMDEWVDKKIITVKANSILYNNTPATLFLPRFVEERLDKTTADTLEKIEQIFEEAKQGIK